MPGVWHRKVGADWVPQSSYRMENLVLATSRSGKDANGVFTVIEQRREDGTLDSRSTLSGGVSPQYTTRTIEFFAMDGATILRTLTLSLTYDVDGNLTSEQIAV